MNIDRHEQDKSNSDLPNPTVNSPLSAQKYTRFYKTMLILSTIGTSIMVMGIINLPTIIDTYATAPLYSIINIAGYVVTLLSVVALVLLWRKDINGLYLKIGTYVAAVLLNIGIFFTSSTVLGDLADEATREMSKQGKSLNNSTLTAIIDSMFFVAIVLTIMSAVIFAVLWLLAWKGQVKADSKD